MRAQSVLTAREHGRYLYLYTNFRTHQVVYSLSRALNNTSALKQLNFYGKKTKPRALRKDTWRPFATVKFPTPEHGLNAIQKLREYRKLRDYTWTWKPTATELEDAKSHIADGLRPPKFDLSLPTKTERAKLLMDQRAYSVADLADVLEREEARLVKRQEEEKRSAAKAQGRKNAEWRKVVELAKKAKGTDFVTLNGRIRRKEHRIKHEKMSERELTKARHGARLMKTERNGLLRALEAVEFVKGKKIAPLENREKWNRALRAMVQERTDREVIPSTEDEVALRAAIKAAKAAEEVTAMQATKSKPRANPKVTPKKDSSKDLAVIAEAPPTSAIIKGIFTGGNREARKEAEQQAEEEEDAALDRSQIPESAILIQWSDLTDAEYASRWPENVYHEWMGHVVDHVAPRAGAEPKTRVHVNGVVRDGEWLAVGELTLEEQRQLRKGVDLDGESSEEGGDEQEGKDGEKKEDDVEEPEEKPEKEGRLARLTGRFIPQFAERFIPRLGVNMFDVNRKRNEREGKVDQ